MSLLWFQGPAGKPFQFQCGSQGIHFPSLAYKLHLKPRPLELNGVVVDFDSSSGYMFAVDFLGGLGTSKDSPIPVTGQPAGERPTQLKSEGVCVDAQYRRYCQARSHVTSAADAVSSRRCITHNHTAAAAAGHKAGSQPLPVLVRRWASTIATAAPILLAWASALTQPVACCT